MSCFRTVTITLPEEDALFLEELAVRGATTESAILRAALRALAERAAKQVLAEMATEMAAELLTDA